jgi:phytoene dehydrogenase-like protein
VDRLRDLPPADVTLCDVTPRQLLALAGEQFSTAYRNGLRGYRYGPAAFKVDYALSCPIPWAAEQCRRSATVHVGGSLEDVAASESAMSHSRVADRPFLLVAQPSLFDPTRAPTPVAGHRRQHVAWIYCHVPHAWTEDVLPAIESQMERFAPGFRDCVLERSVLTPKRLESMDANLVGGDINGGAMDAAQFLFRPTARFYRTSASYIFLCSSSTPPGGGVHGMCGHNAAHHALRYLASLKE